MAQVLRWVVPCTVALVCQGHVAFAQTELAPLKTTATFTRYVGSDVRLPVGGLGVDVAGPSAATVRDKLRREADHVAPQGFVPTLAEVVRDVRTGTWTGIRIGLSHGVEYAFVAACEGCAKVGLILLDDRRQELARSPDEAEVVILNGPAPATADFEVALSVPGCVSDSCTAGMLLLRRGPAPAIASPQPPAASPPVAPDIEAADFIESVQRQLKRVGCYDGDIDGDWGPLSISGLRKFNERAKLAHRADTPDAATLAALERHADRVCPLECDGRDCVENGERRAEGVRPGSCGRFFYYKDGECVDARLKRRRR
jgi:hypothetical protein